MRRPIAILALHIVLSAGASAFTESTYEAIALHSLRLAPPGLARMADKNKKELLRGALAPLGTEGGAEHLASPRGVGERRLREQTERVIGMISDRSPFDRIIYELGVLSHYVADLSNPLNTASGDPRYERIRKDFEGYIHRSMPKFVLTFEGHNSEELLRQDVEGFARSVASRSSRLGPYLSRSYFPNGGMVTSRVFDDRHTAFGVASVSYGNAIGDCARLYVYIWRQVNGDLRGTPFIDGVKSAMRQERNEGGGVFRW